MEQFLCGQQDVLNHRVEHFTELLDGFIIFEMDTTHEELIVSIEEVDLDVPAHLEINTAIGKLKNSKAPGSDSIPAELLKLGGPELNKSIYPIISHI
jgi:hypothetical protein